MDAIKAEAEKLNKVMEPIVVAMYQKAAEEAKAAGTAPNAEWTGQPGDGESDDRVVDADFKVKESNEPKNGGKTGAKTKQRESE